MKRGIKPSKGRMTEPDSLEIIYRVFRHLIKEKEGMTLFDIEGALKKEGIAASHATMHSIISALLKEKQIEIVKTEPFKTGIIKKFYGLTPEGLGFATEIHTYNGYKWDPTFFLENSLEISKINPHLSPILQKAKEWRMESTPHLLQLFIKASHDNEFKSPESVASLVAFLMFIDGDEKILWANGFMPDIWGEWIGGFDKGSIVKELRIFANNNPWVLEEVRSLADSYGDEAGAYLLELGKKVKDLNKITTASDEQLLKQLEK